MIDGHADFLSKPFLGLHADVEIEKIPTEDLLPVTGRYNVQLRKGTLTAKGHIEYAPHTKDIALKQLLLEGVRVDYVHSKKTAMAEKQRATQAAEAVKEAQNDRSGLVVSIGHAKIVNSEFGFVNEASSPDYRVFLADLNMEMENFSNRLRTGLAVIKLTGNFMGMGPTLVTGTFRPEKPSLDFDLDVRIVKTKLKSMNNVLRAYIDADVSGRNVCVF